MSQRRIIIGITGATGGIYAVRLLQILQTLPTIETHLLISAAGVLSLQQELDIPRKDIEALATVVHNVRDIGANIASGSYPTEAMIIAPCSMKTLAAIAHGLSDNLITRAADVTLKERRRLILMIRETPFNLVHLRNMTTITEMGGIIFPPLPAFYQRPKNMMEMIDHTVGRVLSLINVEQSLNPPWKGMALSE